MDFLWIAISWQSPWRYRDIVTIATSADDRHQAHGEERAKQWRQLCRTGVRTPQYAGGRDWHGGGHGMVVLTLPTRPPALPHPVSYSCLIVFTWQATCLLTWLDTALVVLSHCRPVNWRGKMMYVTSSHDIAAWRYRRANFVLRYRHTEKSLTIS